MLGARVGGGKRDEEMDGMDHDTSDRIESEPAKKGGLTRAGSNVSNSMMSSNTHLYPSQLPSSGLQPLGRQSSVSIN